VAFELLTPASMGFCQGVRRAIERVIQVSNERNGVQTLGALVHNRQVQRRLDENGVKVVDSVESITGDVVVISAHGVGPRVIEEIKSRNVGIIDTTCPYVSRAQQAASRLHQSGFYVVVFGDADHVEVKGILGWAAEQGIATLDVESLLQNVSLPRKIGIVSQTTQIPDRFAAFVASLVNSKLFKDAEVRIIDTICHDSRKRQAETLDMAGRCDLVFVIGGRHSANTRHLKELCGAVTETCLIETASEVFPSVLEGRQRVGVTAGASTDDDTINNVIKYLKELSG